MTKMSPWLVHHKIVPWISVAKVMSVVLGSEMLMNEDASPNSPFPLCFYSCFSVAVFPTMVFKAITSQTETTIRFYVSDEKHWGKLIHSKLRWATHLSAEFKRSWNSAGAYQLFQTKSAPLLHKQLC